MIPSAPAIALPVAFLGLLFLCLWRGWLRWLGLPFACAVLLWPRAAPPDVWIGEDGTNLAVRVGDEAWLARPRVRLFAADIWSRRRGLALADEGAQRSCRRSWCSMTVGDETWAVWFGRRAPEAEQLAEVCAGAVGVAVRAEVGALPEACAGALVLDGMDFRRGSVELWREGDRLRGVWAADLRGDRPWTRRE